MKYKIVITTTEEEAIDKITALLSIVRANGLKGKEKITLLMDSKNDILGFTEVIDG